MLNEDLATRRAALDQIVEDLRARQAELVDRGVARIFGEIPAYSKISHTSFVADVRDHVDVHHDAVLRSLAARRPLEGEELAFMRARAARRVGRVPLGDFMQGFRVYMEVLWEALLESAADDHAREAALEAAGIFIRYLNAAATEAAAVYVEAERLLRAQGDRVRRDLLEDLLAGRTPAPGPKLMAARDAGLLPAVPCVVIVAVPLSPPEDEHALRAVAVALARAVGSALQPLTVTRHDELVLIARVEGDVADLIEALGQAQERLAAVRQFVADDLADGRVLTTTLLEYVAADFNARLTAERLFLHPNTARYRLGKIEERTGCNLRRVSDVMDLLIAVRVAEAELADA